MTDIREFTAVVAAKATCPACKENSMVVEAIKRDLFSDGGTIERICTGCRFWSSEAVDHL